MLSWLLVEDIGDGDATPVGDVGEMVVPFGVCAADVSPLMPPSESFTSVCFLDPLAPAKLFFCLNFSSQLVLFAFRWLSEFPTVVAKNRAFSFIILSVTCIPCFCEFFAQTDNARSMSGNLPF